jgi:hypothetical protein
MAVSIFLYEPEIGDMNECVVERGKDAGYTENEFT